MTTKFETSKFVVCTPNSVTQVAPAESTQLHLRTTEYCSTTLHGSLAIVAATPPADYPNMPGQANWLPAAIANCIMDFPPWCPSSISAVGASSSANNHSAMLARRKGQFTAAVQRTLRAVVMAAPSRYVAQWRLQVTQEYY